MPVPSTAQTHSQNIGFNRYPGLPRALLDDRLLKDDKTTENELKNLFRGKWIISAGLNPSFDTFDCQVHEFYAPKEGGQSGKVVADATFSYRVQVDGDKFITKIGPKKLALVKDEPVGERRSNENELLFERGKKWGIDSFSVGDERRDKQHTDGYRLILTLRPNAMDYKDEWSVLSYSNDKTHGFIVLAYQGTNAAWEGYGGLNIYTRSPITIQSLIDAEQRTDYTFGRVMAQGIKSGLDKVGLSLTDLMQVDNSCDEDKGR